MSTLSNLTQSYTRVSLVLRIVIGIALGVAFAGFSPETATSLSFLGSLFVSALKAVAPVLIFILVIASLANQNGNQVSNLRPIIGLYLIGTISAATIAVLMSSLFPATLTLTVTDLNQAAPQGIGEVINTLLFKVVDNPINAILSGNYIGILAWAIGLGLLLRNSNPSTKSLLDDMSTAVTGLVQFVIQLAPFGIFGLVAGTFATTGFSELSKYAHLLMLLIGSMLIVALIINPLIVLWLTKSNPYPLVLRCLRESGITAFFTRSSAANIPVNMALCEKLELDQDTYSVSIPLGATINMAGAAITITVMTLAAVNTLNIDVDIATTLLLCVLSGIAACGASGVAGGSLLLIPLACGLFSIDNDIAMQVVAIGFIIGVIQDSAETALNSSTDVVFTAAVCQKKESSAPQRSN